MPFIMIHGGKMSLNLKIYVVEFFEENNKIGKELLKYEHVFAEDAYEAIDSIKIGWPNALIIAVYVQVWHSGEDEEVEI